ncbi:MAG TPA: hypothetical protein DCY51_08310 [Bacteroidetes bacterium]|nr:hypothetical protein [Bacteroidota bacterium]
MIADNKEYMTLTIAGNLKGIYTSRTKHSVFYDIELSCARSEGIDLTQYALVDIMTGLRARGTEKTPPMISRAVDGYQLILKRIEGAYDNFSNEEIRKVLSHVGTIDEPMESVSAAPVKEPWEIIEDMGRVKPDIILDFLKTNQIEEELLLNESGSGMTFYSSKEGVSISLSPGVYLAFKDYTKRSSTLNRVSEKLKLHVEG